MSYAPYPAGFSDSCLSYSCQNCVHMCPHQAHHHSHEHHVVSAPTIRNGVYQYPLGYRSQPPWLHDLSPQQPLPTTTDGHCHNNVQPVQPVHRVHVPWSAHSHHHHRQDAKYDGDADFHHRMLPREQRGYESRKGDIITTYFPKTPAQLAFENEEQARRDKTYEASRVEPEDKTLDRRWEVIRHDGTRDYMTFAAIKNAFPDGEWRPTERGQWRYHISKASALPKDFDLDDSDDGSSGTKPDDKKSAAVDKKDDKKPAAADKKDDKKPADEKNASKKVEDDARSDRTLRYPWDYSAYGGYYPVWHSH